MKQHGAVLCDYCGKPAVFRQRSDHIFRQDYGPIYECQPCEARVGCHPATKRGIYRPLGRLAKADLRAAKSRAHIAFDRLWKAKIARDGCTKAEAMRRAYRWLAHQLDIPTAECHIAMMDLPLCNRVVDVCTNRATWKPWPPSLTITRIQSDA